MCFFFFFRQKTAYDLRISDWSSDVCSSDQHMTGRFGMHGGQYQAVEFCGEAVRALSMQERMTLSNMSAELGAQAGLVAPDATTVDYLRQIGRASSRERVCQDV